MKKYVVSYMSYFDNEVIMKLVLAVSSNVAILKVLELNGIVVEHLDLEDLIEECFNMDLAVGVIEV